jgi:hypothetical protein
MASSRATWVWACCLIQVTGTYASAVLLAASVAIVAALMYLRFGRAEPVDT